MIKRNLDHKFRFQLLAKWVEEKYGLCKVADVAGGKGLLTFLLNLKGFEATVIDPCDISLISKYKDIDTGKRVLIKPVDSRKIPRRKRHFVEDMAKDYDLLIGLHAHGCNRKIVDGCKKYGKKFVLLPCCVVHEPIEIKPNINWFDSLLEYAREQDFEVGLDELNFKGQNKIIYSR